MKTPSQWVKENSQSGAFDTVGSIADAEHLIQKVQKDVIGDGLQLIREMKELIAECEATAWDGDPLRRAEDVSCITARKLIARADAVLAFGIIKIN